MPAMTSDEAFLQAVIEAPDDDAPRLVYADWLEEHGQPERAEFIRVQCQLAKLARGDGGRKGLQVRERNLLARHAGQWLGRLQRRLQHWVFRRGFVEQVRLNAQTFVAHADDLFRLGPVRQVTLVGAARQILSVAASPYLLRLDVLDLKGGKTRLGDQGVRLLAGSPNVGRLVRLDLGGNDIGDVGAAALANAPHLGRLKALHLCGNRIRDEGWLALATSPHLSGLSHLDLSGNGIDRRRRGARALLARFGHRVHF
jgi:uncharacterized protein (TIGR02996 family)